MSWKWSTCVVEYKRKIRKTNNRQKWRKLCKTAATVWCSVEQVNPICVFTWHFLEYSLCPVLCWSKTVAKKSSSSFLIRISFWICSRSKFHSVNLILGITKCPRKLMVPPEDTDGSSSTEINRFNLAGFSALVFVKALGVIKPLSSR